MTKVMISCKYMFTQTFSMIGLADMLSEKKNIAVHPSD